MKLEELVEKVGEKYRYINLTYVAQEKNPWKINVSHGEVWKNVQSTNTAEEGLELVLKDAFEKDIEYKK